MGNTKEINIKNRTHYFFDDMINIKDFDSNLLKKDKMLYKNIDICCVRYTTMKDSDYVKIYSVKSLYLIIDKVDGFIEEKNENKYLTLVSTDKNKKVLTKYTKVWNGIKNLIEKLNNKPGKYGKDLTKIKFNSDDSLPLNKKLKLHNMTIIIRSIFQEDGKYYPQVFLDVCLYEL